MFPVIRKIVLASAIVGLPFASTASAQIGGYIGQVGGRIASGTHDVENGRIPNPFPRRNNMTYIPAQPQVRTVWVADGGQGRLWCDGSYWHAEGNNLFQGPLFTLAYTDQEGNPVVRCTQTPFMFAITPGCLYTHNDATNGWDQWLTGHWAN